jgi:chemotaxis protein methyltransferase CheR
MSRESFQRFSSFIHSHFGIKMPEAKKTMLESRLLKRLKKLGMESFDEYGDYVFSSEGMKKELMHMVDVVTTNKTEFFREPDQFDFLTGRALIELHDQFGIGQSRPLSVWSAGCSTGEEPYTLAMVISEFAKNFGNYRYSILGTDISRWAIDAAIRGIYRTDRAEPIPAGMKRKYLMRSRSRDRDLVRIIPELRAKIRFRCLNLMDGDFGMDDSFDLIFCRNVIIYFDKPTQRVLIHKLYDHLIQGGYLFLGHSETLYGFDVPLTQVSPMIYRKA